jgi:hypothetical protein
MLFSTLMEIYRGGVTMLVLANSGACPTANWPISASLVPTSTESPGKTPARPPEPAAFTTNARQTAGVCTSDITARTKALNGNCPRPKREPSIGLTNGWPGWIHFDADVEQLEGEVLDGGELRIEDDARLRGAVHGYDIASRWRGRPRLCRDRRTESV